MRVVAQVFVERAQHRHTGAQHVHRMSLAWKQPQHFRHLPRQCALRSNLLPEIGQLLPIGQLAVQQQVRDLLETRLLRHFMNVVTAIHQPGIWIDPADRGFAGDHAG